MHAPEVCWGALQLAIHAKAKLTCAVWSQGAGVADVLLDTPVGVEDCCHRFVSLV